MLAAAFQNVVLPAGDGLNLHAALPFTCFFSLFWKKALG
jgi:hypothetical protein